MPKKNKKPSKNGYWEFALECRSKNPSKHTSDTELQAYASQKWAAMTKEQKQPYEHRANLARNNYNPARLTTDGQEIEKVEQRAEEGKQQIKRMKQETAEILAVATENNKLTEEIFLIIHVNHLIYVPGQDAYFISEIGIAAVSLKNGVEDVFHAIVKPGSLPLGFSGGAMAHSKETHQLYDLVMTGETNTPEVFHDMMAFIRNYPTSQKGLIVYADDKTREMTTKVINELQENFGHSGEVRVFQLTHLFYLLRNAVAGNPVWTTESFSFNELEKDVYSYTPNISCEFHEMADVLLYCSKSIVTRYAYTICDHCCGDANVQIVPGFHVPTKSKVAPKSASRTSSHAPSVCSNDDIRSRSHSRTATSFASVPTYADNYPPLSSARSAASSLRSFSSMKAGSSADNTATRLEKSFKALSVKEVDKRNHAHDKYKFPDHGPKKS